MCKLQTQQLSVVRATVAKKDVQRFQDVIVRPELARRPELTVRGLKAVENHDEFKLDINKCLQGAYDTSLTIVALPNRRSRETPAARRARAIS